MKYATLQAVRALKAKQEDMRSARENAAWGERPPYRHPHQRKPSSARKKIAIVAHRDFFSVPIIVEKLKRKVLDKYDDAVILLDSESGPNKLFIKWASWHWLNYRIYHLDTDRWGKLAAIKRHRMIIKDCDRLIAFWDEVDPVTETCIEIARELKKPVRLFKE